MRSSIWAVVLSLAAVALLTGNASAQYRYYVVTTTYYPVYDATPTYSYAVPSYTYYAAPTYYSSSSYAPASSGGYYSYYYTPSSSYSTYSGSGSSGHPPYRWAGYPHGTDYDAWGRAVSGYELWQISSGTGG